MDEHGTASGTQEEATVPGDPYDLEKSWAKIRLKHAPKQYKTQAGLRGRARLERTLVTLTLAAVKMRRTSAPGSDDSVWSQDLVETLQAFTRRHS